MDEDTARALDRLNVAFYRDHAGEFSAKRERPWAGWSRLLDWLPEAPRTVLDVGCGNGRFGRFLAGRGLLARYVGIDASEPLLTEARAGLGDAAELQCADWFAPTPERALPRGGFDVVALFGVVHGVAGEARRLALLRAAARRVSPGGLLVFTCWDFAEQAQRRGRFASWDHPEARAARIDPGRLDPGDHLLAWGDGAAVRYAHSIDEDELRRLTGALSLSPIASYTADGRGGGRNRYAILRAGIRNR